MRTPVLGWGIKTRLRRLRARLQRQSGAGSAVQMPDRERQWAEYTAWLEERIALRSREYSPAASPGISILTCLYDGSDADLFRATCESVLRQTHREFEWIVLAQGDVSAALQSALAVAEADGRLVVLRRPDNAGIIRGLSLCLEAAHNDYVMPLDGDDLLTPDALHIVTSALASAEHPEFLYGDEDFCTAGHFRDPYIRPDWDPLLNVSSSYVWHPSVFRRETALALGVFSDEGADFCQDWDTVFRFVDAGFTPLHIPEVLYHWTSHESSSTNRPRPAHGSLLSQRHVLEAQRQRLENNDLFEVRPFPLDRGLPELRIARRHTRPEPIDVIICGDEEGALEAARAVIETGFPFHALYLLGPSAAQRAGRDGEQASIPLSCIPAYGLDGLREIVRDLSSGMSLIVSSPVILEGDEAPWEALGIRALVPDAAFVCGRVHDGRRILTGPLAWQGDARFACPYAGWGLRDGGPFAMALKPHTVDGFAGQAFFADNATLHAALASLPEDVHLENVGPALSAWARGANVRVAYSPLISLRTLRRDAAL